MRTLPAGWASQLASGATELAVCYRLERRDAVVFGATNHDRDLTIDGDLYRAGAGHTPSAVESRADLSVSNMELAGVLDSEGLTAADLMAGLYDGAALRVFLVRWSDPDGGVLELGRGTLGEVKRLGLAFSVEVRGLTQALQATVGEVLTPTCRADLGDARCTVDLGALSVSGTLTDASGRASATDTARAEADDYWTGGLLSMTSGANAGYAREVASSTAAGVLEVFEPFPHPLAAGDDYSLSPGCDKRLATCIARYDNAVNFRGEPGIPGTDELMRYGGGG
jgi:uncharacterized phage protein (TIGR02218 family)